MLSTLVNVHASEKNSIDLTLEDFETFYRIIVQGSYDKNEHLHDTLILVRNNCYDFLSNHLHTPAKKNILISQLTLLKANNFFTDKFALSKLDDIINDITQDGKHLVTLLKTERQNFLDLLHNINNEYQTMSPTVKSFPDSLKTGLSTEEKTSLSYSASLQTSSPGVSLCTKGVKHFEKKEWKEASQHFEQAIKAEEELALETKKNVDRAFITIYLRNLYVTYAQEGGELFKNNSFVFAIEKFNAAINTLEKIESQNLIKQDAEQLACFQRFLSQAYNFLGMEFFENKNYETAISHHQTAITFNQKIKIELFTEEDAEYQHILKRNLIYVFHQFGIHYFYEKNYPKALEKFDAAEAIFHTLNAELKTAIDDKMLERIQKHKNMILSINSSSSSTVAFFSPDAASPNKDEDEEKTEKIEPPLKKQKR